MNVTLYKRCKCPTRPNCDHPYWFKFMHGGKLFQKTTRRHTVKDAERFADKEARALRDDHDGIAPRAARATRVTLRELADRYIPFHASHKPNSAGNAARSVEHFVRITGGDRDIRTITPGDVEHYRTTRGSEPNPCRRGATISRGTIRTETISVRALFRQAEIWYGVRSPWAIVTRADGTRGPAVAEFHVDEDEIQVATPDECRRVFRELPEPYNLWCELTYRVLPRLSEVVNLKRGDVGVTMGRDGLHGYLVRRLKGGKQKRVGIPLRLAQRLIAFLRTDDQIYLFPDHVGSNTTSAELYRLFRAIGLPHLHHHVFRHTGITRMVDGGTNNNAIKELAGWSSLRQLARYGHVSDAERDRAASINAVDCDDIPTTTPAAPAAAPAPAPARRRTRKPAAVAA